MQYVEVLLLDPDFYDPDGTMYVSPQCLEWQRVEYRDPDQCGCSIYDRMRIAGLVPHDGSKAAQDAAEDFVDRESERLGVDGVGATMCSNCREEWELDHKVRGPWL